MTGTTKNKIARKLGIIFLPSIFWVLLTAFGFGAQSLANLVELFAIFILSLIGGFLPERLIKFKYLLIVLFLITFLSRLFMPILPE